MDLPIYALDFDGVLCDSVRESSITAVNAAAKLWPQLNLPDPNDAAAEWILDALSQARPFIMTGFEIVIMARMLAATTPAALQDDFVTPIMEDWASLRDDLMEQWDLNKDDLVAAFGGVRDIWIQNDIDSWISSNKIFPGVVDALNFTSSDVYIITTKEKRFCKLLLEKAGVKTVPEERIFGLEAGSKISVLKKLLSMPQYAGREISFVEDRYETLEAVSISMLGQPLQLYLATWGYNTEKTRRTAEKHPFISLIDLNTFVSKFQ